MIHFLFGRAGSGKTYRIREEIRRRSAEGGRRLFLIVPEQQTYIAERTILSSLPPEAGLFFTIVSFSRLCALLSDRFGGRSHASVTGAMRSLLMWENLRELQGTLEVYPFLAAEDRSLCCAMLRVVDECRYNAVTPARLEDAAERLGKDAPLSAKLRDFALVSASFDGILSEAYGENPSDRLARAAEQLKRHAFFEGASVYLDSFTGFTAEEYAIIREIFRQADETTVSLGSDGREAREPQFAGLNDTARRLTRLCEDVGQPYDDVVLRGARRGAPPELAELERRLWSFGAPPVGGDELPEGERGRIHLIEARNAYDEAQAAALHILALAERGVPYRRMAVVVRDVALWKGILDAALERYDIPYFLSDRTDLNEKPAARLLLTALRCLSRGFQANDVIALCKTGLCGLSPRDADCFQDYMETWRLGGSRMREPVWNMNPSGYTADLSDRDRDILEAANRVRETIMAPLLTLERKLRAAKTVAEECRALYGFLRDLSVREQLTAEAESCLSLGQVREAGEAVRLWQFLTETLASVAAVLGDLTDRTLTAEELGTALSIVFSETDIGSVPAHHDCVTVGSASTLRVDDIEAMLLLGLCEGEFPKGPDRDGLLSEQDKAALADLGVEFRSREETLNADELLYLYSAMTKPSGALILSRHTSAADGQARNPSIAFLRVRHLFPYLEPTPFSASLLDDGRGDGFPTPDADRLSRGTARRILGGEISLSQSRLQTFARCPYSFYGRMMLRLRARTEARFENLNAGIFLHRALELYVRRALDGERRLRPLTDAEMAETSDAVVRECVSWICGDAAGNGRLLRLFDRLRHIVSILIAEIQEELANGPFRVAGLEWNIGGERETDPRPLILTLEGAPGEGPPVRLVLGGRIDRVDFFRPTSGDAVYVRVVDYKASRHEFTLRSIIEDMDVQLPLYLFALCAPENRRLFTDDRGRKPEILVPAEVMYLSPDESDRSGIVRPCRTGAVVGSNEILAAVGRFLPSLKPGQKVDGLHNASIIGPRGMEDLERTLRELVLRTASDMYSGRADRTPSDKACRYCILRDCCPLTAGEDPRRR